MDNPLFCRLLTFAMIGASSFLAYGAPATPFKAASTRTVAAKTGAKPNIVFFIADDLGAIAERTNQGDFVGMYGLILAGAF